jgi:hypothetical protein
MVCGKYHVDTTIPVLRRAKIPTTEMTLFVIVGLVLFVGSMIGLTTFGGKYPRAALGCIFLTLAIYVAIILVRIGIIDLS